MRAEPSVRSSTLANNVSKVASDVPRPDCPPRFVLGFDVGGTATKAAVFTLDGALVARRSFDSKATFATRPYAGFVQQTALLLDDARIRAGAVAAVGLAVPGAVGPQGTLEMCPNLDLDLESCKVALRGLLPGAAVAALNDANAAALGDFWRGSAHAAKAENVVLVTLGTGVGAGVIAGGRLVTGGCGIAGEVGHLCVNQLEGRPCSCGMKGCLEQYASGTALLRMAREGVREAANRCDAGLAGVGQEAVRAFPDVRAVLQAADRCDVAARDALARFSHALGFGLAQMACLLDPDLFVLGGGLSARADLFLPAVQARYKECALPACRRTPIAASVLGNDCGMYGAALHAVQAVAASSHPGAATVPAPSLGAPLDCEASGSC